MQYPTMLWPHSEPPVWGLLQMMTVSTPGKPGHVHDPGEVRREHVPPAAPDGRHFEDAVLLRPCADRHGPAALHRGPLPV